MAPNTDIIFAGVGTESCIVTVAGIYTVDVDSSVRPDSSLQIEVKQATVSKGIFGGSAANPAELQQTVGGKLVLKCAALDQIDVIMTSSAPTDINFAKTSINIYQGT